MPPQKIQDRILQMAFHAPALGGLRLQQIFCAEDDDDRAAPIRNRIAKKCADMSARIGVAITNDPERENGNADDAQGMTVEKSPASVRFERRRFVHKTSFADEFCFGKRAIRGLTIRHASRP
jgi:hypothetical protein